MKNDKHTLMDSIEQLCAYHKSNPGCFTQSDLNDLETLGRYANQLLGAAHRNQLNDERLHHTFDNAHALRKKLERKCKDYACQKKWQEGYLSHAKFNPYHKPSGSPEGGQFDNAPGGGSSDGGSGSDSGSPRSPSGGGSTSPSPDKLPGVKPSAGGNSPKPKKPINIDKSAQHAIDNIDKTHRFGNGKCATNVRKAVEAGLGHPIPTEDLPPIRKGPNPRIGVYEETRWARDYGSTFEKAGLSKKITVEAGGGDSTPRYQPKIGDVAVIQPTSDPKHPEGHTAIYTGEGWVSDYNQGKNLYPNSLYRSEKPSYTIYRKPD